MVLTVLQNDAAADSLLSLSIAAASVNPIPLPPDSALASLPDALPSPPPVQTSTSTGSSHKTHRRLASTGKRGRRLSDAREAASRPSPAMMHASPPALSLASLSLSSSPPVPAHTSKVLSSSVGAQAVPLSDGSNILHSTPPTDAKPIPIGSGKKRGVEHKCESCSKIYRHPSCLIKHRWEHTPHWREASKFVLSKHQQVQLLEAAAILSHLSPTSSSLPDDRSLWPSFLSGGSLPPPDPSTMMSPPKASPSSTATATHMTVNGISGSGPGTVSSSVPATTGFSRPSSAGPRMHDYAIPAGASLGSDHGGGGVTQLRPGLLGVPTSNDSNSNMLISSGTPHPMSVPITAAITKHSHSKSWSAAVSTGMGGNGGGWSLPRSSVRSISGSSRSRSGSASDEDNDNDMEEVESGDELSLNRRYSRTSKGYGYSHHRTQPRLWKNEEEVQLGRAAVGSFGGRWSVREEDEYEKTVVASVKSVKDERAWDGMEMEMDMD
ncbi:hypothetical protein Agabi119p4_11223 [Agaricus bisporus var. burnettii]|uniref:C2H2-type domain-containing protein n=1 Tax=Agaricus bisporus var. burnettii TaxID=192524 RepID=A0A8H7C167_AGABI|nr:hypothetical protein Agabi119p4_11223 [Agaricus bisporus var. burnettii]